MRQLLSDGTLEIDTDLLKRTSFAVGGLEFDNENGVGAVPNLVDIFWKGVLVAMTPRMFLSLTPSLAEEERPKTTAFLEANSLPLGSPFLIVRINTETGELAAWGHEGRHRMARIGKTMGMDIEIPVGLFVLEDHYQLKAREIETSLIEKIAEGVRREKSKQFVHGPLFDKAVWSHGELGLGVSGPKAETDVNPRRNG
ncbi:hypothetical protein O9X98_05575 [Agrobacterium salinitolerans]|nr:hypothetical protein [Agrobacterium salinitolerans]